MPDKGTSTTDAPDDAPADEVRATDAPDAPDALREAFILAPTPAAGARIIGQPGKWVRDILRGMGTYVGGSHGADNAVYDETVRAALYDACRARLNKRNAPHGDGS